MKTAAAARPAGGDDDVFGAAVAIGDHVKGAAVPAAGPPLLPPGWAPWTIHPSKKNTRYHLEMLDGRMALRADADASASGLITPLSIDPNRQPVLTWRWRIDSLVNGADNTDRHAEDAPVRVVLAFDGDKRTLPFRDQVFFEQVKLLAGRDLPYATLMYIWENRKPVGSVIRNPNTDRVRKIVVASGPAGVRKWMEFRRNIVEDYKLAFGKPPPGRLVGVAILTDTDNTRQKVTAWYGDIMLTR
ncbi:MAG TPA: DUF3047 domain-containing protein [Burkholderiaceae bacterium]|nr:DUF3047 domain-containing protein [Burkholderiaceae bacterium]